jgi:hypothetical protein
MRNKTSNSSKRRKPAGRVKEARSKPPRAGKRPRIQASPGPGTGKAAGVAIVSRPSGLMPEDFAQAAKEQETQASITGRPVERKRAS